LQEGLAIMPQSSTRTPTTVDHIPGSSHRDDAAHVERAHAAAIQRALLPRRWPRLDGFDFAAEYHPADGLAGDFYDTFALGGQAAAFYVADVSGHGLGPALITVLLRQTVVDLRRGGRRDVLRSPGRAIAAIRRRLAAEDLGEHFITLLYGVVHGLDRTLIYASAGHPPPLLWPDGEPDEPAAIATGPILSPLVEPGGGWPERTVELPPGSRVAAYTDGLIDAWDRDSVPFGLPGLRHWLSEGRHLDGEDWARRAIAAARRHAGAAGPPDDMTLLVISAEG
jgi:serine phosphatase RsbU (regulator of sigma subunit)